MRQSPPRPAGRRRHCPRRPRPPGRPRPGTGQWPLRQLAHWQHPCEFLRWRPSVRGAGVTSGRRQGLLEVVTSRQPRAGVVCRALIAAELSGARTPRPARKSAPHDNGVVFANWRPPSTRAAQSDPNRKNPHGCCQWANPREAALGRPRCGVGLVGPDSEQDWGTPRPACGRAWFRSGRPVRNR